MIDVSGKDVRVPTSREAARVLVAGAINTDLVAVVDRAPDAGETVTGTSFHIYGGGKGANQAVAAARSGAVVTLIGAVGNDAFGQQRLSDLERDGIDLDAVERRDDASSGVALIVVDQAGENRITYVPGATLTVDAERLVNAIERLKPVVYLQPNEVRLDAAKAALAHAGGIGARRILNAAPDPTEARPLLSEVDLLIVNRGEALALWDGGNEADLSAMAVGLAGQLGVDVVITAGADGVFAHVEGKALHQPAPKLTVVDTTGAGDAFCGALAARLAQQEPFVDALRWAVTAASLATTIEGAQPSIRTADEIRTFLNENEGSSLS